MEEDYISVKEYMRRFNKGYETVMNLIETNQVEYILTPSGKYRIKIGGDKVSKELYDKAIERAVKAETQLEVIKNIVISERGCD